MAFSIFIINIVLNSKRPKLASLLTALSVSNSLEFWCNSSMLGVTDSNLILVIHNSGGYYKVSRVRQKQQPFALLPFHVLNIDNSVDGYICWSTWIYSYDGIISKRVTLLSDTLKKSR